MQERDDSQDDFCDIFEDPEDMLESVYDKIEDACFHWTIFAKTFLEDVEATVLKEVLLDMVGNVSEDFYRRVAVKKVRTDRELEISAIIRRFFFRPENDHKDGLR